MKNTEFRMKKKLLPQNIADLELPKSDSIRPVQRVSETRRVKLAESAALSASLNKIFEVNFC